VKNLKLAELKCSLSSKHGKIEFLKSAKSATFYICCANHPYLQSETELRRTQLDEIGQKLCDICDIERIAFILFYLYCIAMMVSVLV